jgi:hypothetical protein
MRRSEDRILTSHTGRLFKPGSGWHGMGGAAGPVPAERLQDEVTLARTGGTQRDSLASLGMTDRQT